MNWYHEDFDCSVLVRPVFSKRVRRNYPFLGEGGKRLPVDDAWLLEGRRSERLTPAVSLGLVHWRLVRRVQMPTLCFLCWGSLDVRI